MSSIRLLFDKLKLHFCRDTSKNKHFSFLFFLYSQTTGEVSKDDGPSAGASLHSRQWGEVLILQAHQRCSTHTDAPHGDVAHQKKIMKGREETLGFQPSIAPQIFIKVRYILHQ